MKIALIIGAVLLVIYGIYQLCNDHRKEGFVEVVLGIVEIFFEVLGAFL